jgi:phosphoglycerate dehydrogenase-like enzyme
MGVLAVRCTPMTNPILVTDAISAPLRTTLTEALGTHPILYLADLDPAAREDALRNAIAILARNTGSELKPHEPALIHSARLIQFLTAGVDFVPLSALPDNIPIAANGGAYAEPMAEHAVAMILAGTKRLLVEHAALGRGAFNQFTPNRCLQGLTCGIVGFGGTGVETARLLRAFGMHIHAINRSGRTTEPCDWVGTLSDLDTVLANADVLILSLPLTPATNELIGARELNLMKSDAILVNLARGEIVQEAPLYAHLKANPHFVACIDAWWIEPVRHGVFRMDHPFTDLPNVVASPHNSATVAGVADRALRRAAANIRRALDGETPRYLVSPEECML